MQSSIDAKADEEKKNNDNLHRTNKVTGTVQEKEQKQLFILAPEPNKIQIPATPLLSDAQPAYPV